MNESVGYTVTINIIVTFIVIVFVFISNVIIYYKSNKVGNIITDSIERYSGFNSLAENDINQKLDNIGYNKKTITCRKRAGCTNLSSSTRKKGYCVYYCNEGDSYHYEIKTNMIVNIPIINDVLNLYTYSSTGNMHNLSGLIEGDVDGDGRVNVFDASEIGKYLLKKGNDLKNLLNSDMNNDGMVDCIDSCIIHLTITGGNINFCYSRSRTSCAGED